MIFGSYRLPDKIFMVQSAMLRVVYALLPIALFSIYLFGWRSVALIAVTFAFGICAEAAFTFREGKPVTTAVFVTCMIFALSLPPSLPFWMAALGIVVAVVFGKMVFGGTGLNVFNPAMVGRCFIYITFPIEMTSTWARPFWGGSGGFGAWSPPVEAITQATPLIEIRNGVTVPLDGLLTGNIPGSLGETSVILIVLGAFFLLYKKTASWKLLVSCLAGGIITSTVLMIAGIDGALTPVQTLVSGSFLFGAAFVVTEPITGPKTAPGQWIYGAGIGTLAVLFRLFSNFPEGMMFAVLLMNSIVPIMDSAIRKINSMKRAAA